MPSFMFGGMNRTSSRTEVIIHEVLTSGKNFQFCCFIVWCLYPVLATNFAVIRNTKSSLLIQKNVL